MYNAWPYMQVPKCLYKVRAGEALVDVALKFGTSWLQVFSLCVILWNVEL